LLDVARHDRMVTLVEQMLARSEHERLAAASAPDRELYQRQTVRPAVPGVDATDREIDGLVASRELYGLTEEEIGVIERSG